MFGNKHYSKRTGYKMNHGRCEHCGGEKVPLGRTVKCYDCGLAYGEDPPYEDTNIRVGNWIQNISPWSFITADTDEPDTFAVEFELHGEHTVRALDLVSGDKARQRPFVSDIHPSYYDGVDWVIVWFRDLDLVQQYQAVPFRERDYATATESGGAST